jgi:HSP20 family protein
MALIRWEPATELNTLQNEMNRLFNRFFDQPSNGVDAIGRWIPAMDLVEHGDHYVLRADLPGLSEADVNIELQDNVLTVSGERRFEQAEEQDGYRRIERHYGSFARSLTLPQGIEPEAIKGRFDRGVLEITIPKPEQQKPRKIQIAAGQGAIGAGGGSTAGASEGSSGEASAASAREPQMAVA